MNYKRIQMNKARASLWVGITVFLASVPCLEADELWERTEALVKQSEIWLPGEVQTKQLVKNGKGEVKSENLVVMEVRQNNESGQPEAHLLKLLEGNKDRTEKSKDEVEKEFQSELENLELDMPFYLEDPSAALVGMEEENREIDGVLCVGYRFSVSKEDEDSREPMKFEGVVWVNPDSAAPVEIESHLVDVPHKLEDAEIASLMIRRKYGMQDGQLIPESEEQELWINAKFLFKKMVFFIESATSYRNHWYWKQGAAG